MQTRHLGVKNARQSQPEELEVDLRKEVQIVLKKLYVYKQDVHDPRLSKVKWFGPLEESPTPGLQFSGV